MGGYVEDSQFEFPRADGLQEIATFALTLNREGRMKKRCAKELALEEIPMIGYN